MLCAFLGSWVSVFIDLVFIFAVFAYSLRFGGGRKYENAYFKGRRQENTDQANSDWFIVTCDDETSGCRAL